MVQKISVYMTNLITPPLFADVKKKKLDMVTICAVETILAGASSSTSTAVGVPVE